MRHGRYTSLFAAWRCGGDPGLALSAVATAQRTVSIGGRANAPGFSPPHSKHPRIKQAGPASVVQRVPGTTKIRYTNRKGRVFKFSIPVTQLTHPPVIREGAAADGWHEIDTSFSDVGDLEDPMPTEVDEVLAAAAVPGEAGLVEMNEAQLDKLQRAFVQLCKDYVLMDTTGMKGSLMYSELNSGPDYELFDRKTRRRRHWIAIRHRYEDVKELLWPEEAVTLLARPDIIAFDGAGSTIQGSTAPQRPVSQQETPRESMPVLSLSRMLEALTWLEAASTFAVRTHRPYDTADAEVFTSLDLSREVRIVATCVGAIGLTELCISRTERSARPSPNEASHGAVDDFISLGALCAKHRVPLALAFRQLPPSPSSRGDVPSEVASLPDSTSSIHAWLQGIPPLSHVKDAVRVMTVLQSLTLNAVEKGSAAAAVHEAAVNLRFSDETGAVVHASLLQAICRVVPTTVFSDATALENVGEEEVCVLMRFTTELHEQNAAFMRSSAAALSVQDEDAAAHGRRILSHFADVVLGRCRQLLYTLDGSGASLLSGDAENIPLVDLQAFADHHHPAVRVHEKVGRANAQGLRSVRLDSASSTKLVELLRRMEAADQRVTTTMPTLRGDLLRHVASKAALRKGRLTVEDVVRALPELAAQMGITSENEVKATYAHLFSAISTTIAVALQETCRAPVVLGLLEGLAMCHHVPSSSYRLLEMVAQRMMIQGAFTLSETARGLVAMTQLVGPRGVSQSIQHAIAMRVMAVVEAPSKEHRGPNGTISEVLAVLRALRFSSYPSLASLIRSVAASNMVKGTGVWTPADRVAYGVLLAVAAAEPPLSEEDVEASAHLASEARGALERGCDKEDWQQIGLAPGTEEDARQECLSACAALQLRSVLSCLKAWAETPIGSRTVHSMCTPQLAVSTLEALEAFDLESSPWYHLYSAYLEKALTHLQPERGGRRLPLLKDDAATVERCLQLRRPPKKLRSLATTLLEWEIGRLDAARSSGGSGEEGGSTAAQSYTFQQRALENEAATEAAEALMLRYLSTLHHSCGIADAGQTH